MIDARRTKPGTKVRWAHSGRYNVWTVFRPGDMYGRRGRHGREVLIHPYFNSPRVPTFWNAYVANEQDLTVIHG